MVLKKRIESASLLKQVDDYLVSSEDLRGFDTRARHLYPTSASCVDDTGKVHGTCKRKAVLDYYNLGVSNEFKPDTLYTFETGRQLEAMYIDIFKRMGIYAGDHIKFFDPYFHLSGEVDVILRESPGSKKLYICEIKTSHGPYFKVSVITGRPGVRAEPKEEHVLQVLIYLDNYIGIPYARLIYLGRDDFSRTEYVIRIVEQNNHRYPEITGSDGVPYMDKRYDLASVYNRYRDILGDIRQQRLPARDYEPLMTQEEVDRDYKAGITSKYKRDAFTKGDSLTTEWHCTYCQFRNICRGLPKDSLDNFPARFEANEFKLYDPGKKVQ